MSGRQTSQQPSLLRRLAFYFVYGFRNIQRGGRWTTLAIFCIAAGVATVVALRGLGLSIGESLINSVRVDNKGDILIQRDSANGPDFALLRGSETIESFTQAEIEHLQQYAATHNIDISLFTTGGPLRIAGENDGIISTSQFVVTYAIDPSRYPVFGDIRVIAPPNREFSDLFDGGTHIVISENMASSFGLAVGDTVQVGGTETAFTVSGIVGVEAEAGITNPAAAFFGFAYFDIVSAQRYIDPDLGFNRVGLAYAQGLSLRETQTEIDNIQQVTGMHYRNTDFNSAARSLERRQVLATALGDFIVILGLGSLLIGGVGILNTMLVLVRRRTNEIAALKTFGLKGRQVGMLFLAEGILLGFIGSAIGCVIGVLLGGFVNQFGEQVIQQALVWRIYPEALLYGFALGMATTIIFGIAPILTALQIRPAVILRPNEGHIVTLGCFQTFAVMIIVTVLLGLIVGQIIQPTFGLSSAFSTQDAYFWGVVGVALTLLTLLILTGLLWVVVWLIGKLPAFGWVDLQLALRNLSSQRLRTAITLLALSAGMFALSSITFVGEGTRQILNDILNQSFGGNVLAIPLQPGFNEALNRLATRNFQTALADIDGVHGSTRIGFYNSDLLAIDGRAFSINLEEVNPLDSDTTAPFAWQNFSVWDSDEADMFNRTFNVVVGRNLTLNDAGQAILIGDLESAQAIGIKVGSVLTYRVGEQRVDFTVVGLYSEGSLIGSGGPIMPADALAGRLNPSFQIYTFNVDEAAIPQVTTALSDVLVPRTIALDVNFIDSLVERFITTFAAIPTLVGLLSLLAAAVIMANTIALSTLERRRQIGVLKAVGLKSRRVLFIMLIEATIIGLLSAVLGLGLSSIGISIFTSFSGTVIPLPRESQGIAILLVIAAVIIAWVSTFLSANVAVRERVMNVLRYE